MIIHKRWQIKGGKEHGHRKEGWFLFGFLPLYTRTTDMPL